MWNRRGSRPSTAPHQEVPPSPPAEGEELPEDPEHPRNRPRPFVRSEREKRLKAAERAYQQLGKVNPLALEEFAALEERHQFLSEQLEDLEEDPRGPAPGRQGGRRARRAGLHRGIPGHGPGVRGRLQQAVPGRRGRLILTDPDNMLTTGVDVEARPPGKKVKRLSLLSGGERSLTAVAMLVSIFKARPSPFYVMDEVEAALDDTNLQRLIRIMQELQEASQLIVITHQKRTMEVADALYGVSMQGRRCVEGHQPAVALVTHRITSTLECVSPLRVLKLTALALLTSKLEGIVSATLLLPSGSFGGTSKAIHPGSVAGSPRSTRGQHIAGIQFQEPGRLIPSISGTSSSSRRRPR
ncbi:AAA family ATPase [Streptomyces thinghirensis]|nr:AAA family ATPase [Streptomyces thinghirensis]